MEKSIIVKNLPKYVYVPELCDKFRCFGNIVSATVHYDESVHTGEAYVEFNDISSALTAVKRMNNTKVWNMTLEVSLSSENERFTKIFVKNFSPDWDLDDLLKAFGVVGTIDSADIFETHGKSNGYGYVLFNNHYTAKRAIEIMNGKEVDGHKLVVERFQSKKERDALKKNSLEHVEKMLEQSTQYNNLHVKNLPRNMTEDQLEKLFRKFGSINSVKIMVDENGLSRGFGFVCFESEQDAKKALEKMNGYLLEDESLQISFKQDGQYRKQYYNLKSKERGVKIMQYKEQSKSMPKFLPHALQGRRYN